MIQKSFRTQKKVVMILVERPEIAEGLAIKKIQ